MALNTVFSNRIAELIGSDYSTIAANSYIDLFNAAIASVADMLPPELLLKYAVNPQDLDENTPTWTSVEGKKVLLVTRLDDSSPRLAQECKPVSIQDFEKAKDATSIYLATKRTPVYAYTTDAGSTALTILPEPIPFEDVKAVILKACINILQAYVSDFCQDEEDSEMLQMLGGQVQSLEGQFQGEMVRYQEPDATPRGE